MDTNDTITAVASASGRAERGIIRVSGLDALSVCEKAARLTGNELRQLSSAAAVEVGWQINPVGEALKVSLQVWPDNRSFTRQPIVEIHTVGSPPLLDVMQQQLVAAGARLAEPGEFTMRAFLAGRIDLPQAEAVLGVIDAQDQRSLSTALQQLAGGLSHPLNELRESLLQALAHLEAGLDFVEEDIEFISVSELSNRLEKGIEQIVRIVDQIQARGRADELPRVVLVGEPNAGKSSLFNALLDRPIAIVTNQAGTTRDYVSCPLTIGNRSCLLIDTAGLMHTDEDGIEARAQETTASKIEDADLLIYCVDASENTADTAKQWGARLSNQITIFVANKSDLPPKMMPTSTAWLPTSAQTRQGLDELKNAIRAKLEKAASSELLPNTLTRCSVALEEALSGMQRAQVLTQAMAGDELVSIELRHALDSLGQVVGAVYTDDVLDRIFSQFCIGK